MNNQKFAKSEKSLLRMLNFKHRNLLTRKLCNFLTKTVIFQYKRCLYNVVDN